MDCNIPFDKEIRIFAFEKIIRNDWNCEKIRILGSQEIINIHA